MNHNIYTGIALVFFAASCVTAWRSFARLTEGMKPSIGTAMPKIFVLSQVLYVLPLSVRSFFGMPAEGNISSYFTEFEPYLPAAVGYTAAFNFSLAWFVSMQDAPYTAPEEARDEPGLRPSGWVAALTMTAIAIGMLGVLARDLGGITSLILEGYRVTEHFIGRGYLAVGFEWIVALGVLCYAAASLSGDPKRRLLAIGVNGVIACAFLIMARRATLVEHVGALLLIHHYAVAKFKVWQLVAILAVGFMSLNLIGLLRGDSYDDFTDMKSSLTTRATNLAEEDETWSEQLTYTLTTGNFAVPFETLPQIIRTFGEAYVLGFGKYTLGTLSLIVPLPLWPDRPLPLSNWYVEEFYGITALNEGRQLYFLTESFMDFGAAGFIVVAGLYAIGFRFVLRHTDNWARSAPMLALMALLCSSITSMIAAGPSSFVVTSLKSFAAPLLVVYFADQVFKPRS
jgi:hypothetical protein